MKLFFSYPWKPSWLQAFATLIDLKILWTIVTHLIHILRPLFSKCPTNNNENETTQVKSRIFQIYYWAYDCWIDSELSHPATFHTLVFFTPHLKKIIIDLLNLYHNKERKPLIQNYILYGPPGTGKSTVIAAIANYIKFDVYDLKLSSFYSYSDLHHAITTTTHRSILVIEDIDRIKEVENRGITVSDLLYFMDGLWSEDDRIVILTAEHKENVDDALLVNGKSKLVHIHLPLLFQGNIFESITLNNASYLKVNVDLPLYERVKELMLSI